MDGWIVLADTVTNNLTDALRGWARSFRRPVAKWVLPAFSYALVVTIYVVRSRAGRAGSRSDHVNLYNYNIRILG